MELSEALARTSINRLTEFSSLSDVLEPEVIQSRIYQATHRIYQATHNNLTKYKDKLGFD